MTLKVSILQGANRYVRITNDTIDLDVLLAPGKRDCDALREEATRLRTESYRLQRRAMLCEDAALVLEGREKD
jgi:hypothetical protein